MARELKTTWTTTPPPWWRLAVTLNRPRPTPWRPWGEAQEVGQALDREFPLRWWMLSRVAGCVLLIALLLAVSWLREPVMDLYFYHQAKQDPLSFDWHREELPALTPLDLQAALPAVPPSPSMPWG